MRPSRIVRIVVVVVVVVVSLIEHYHECGNESFPLNDRAGFKIKVCFTPTTASTTMTLRRVPRRKLDDNAKTCHGMNMIVQGTAQDTSSWRCLVAVVVAARLDFVLVAGRLSNFQT